MAETLLLLDITSAAVFTSAGESQEKPDENRLFSAVA
jgi:hypothetical protein